MRPTYSTKSLLLILIFITLSAGCVKKQPVTQEEELYKLNTVIVLPTEIIKSEKISYSQTKNLENGSTVLENVIHQYLANKNGIKFISNEQQETLLNSYNQDRYAQALSIGKQLKGDAVLTSRINRYSEREGKEYAVDAPASISFEYRLMLLETGQTLCAGVFDETQKSWSENILFFKKVFNRGGKWITAEELTKEGLTQKFDSCRYF